MSLSEEYLIKRLLHETLFYVKHKEENETYESLSVKALQSAEMYLERNIRETFINFSPDVIISFCETAMDVTNGYKKAERYIDFFF